MNVHHFNFNETNSTGASSGIGESCAKIFHQNGNHVIILGRRIDKLNEIKRNLENSESKAKVFAMECDVTSSESINDMVTKLPTELKNIDILINNAGLALGSEPVSNISNDEIDRVIDTNVKGVFRVTRSFLPDMIKRNTGHIFNVSSIAGNHWYVNGSIYCASKAAVNAFSDIVRKEVVATKIRVTNVCPGLVETEFSVIRFGGDVEKAKKPYMGIDALTPDDIADNIYYAASRPEHVQITTIETMANNQASTTVIHRV
ncbi:short-chain dehydrogenase/reductase family protein [Heterostelium album PN500]|uniref:Short-chain dehydrogenase/reductase family protein n=1 Tax=Heterostelium pallidum (strain ATCC 26659 / Pp 5 / PN500) TaxID=670386 RepID=D3BHG1_HETP5|nr:short-chain dehydrogenase/reductase family protein [Heterostelium album PN500]EFA79138.1 short-chain dehydrogenase/reductase family protein [Heterostelium album PN500]|eukprot:XP_020431260.1 short-chain dehydrogenase/reductase family protein [Heterostelium album PN500]